MKQRCFVEMAVTFAQRAVNQASIKLSDIRAFSIPLPPMEIQHRIVEEIESEQSLINANHQLIERFEKKIQASLARIWEN